VAYAIDADGVVDLTGGRVRVPATISAEVDLVVFEAMPHAHWLTLHLPETREALSAMADFFKARLGSTQG